MSKLKLLIDFPF